MQIFYVFLSLTIYSLACSGMGAITIYTFTRKGYVYKTSTVTRSATYFLLGQGLLANLWVFISLAGIYSPLFVKVIIIILFVIGLIVNYKLVFNGIKQIVEIQKEINREVWEWKILIIATLIIWLAWISSIGRPPTADGTRFYLALPKIISASEQLKVLPGYEDVASLGLQGEMHFAAFMTMNSPKTIQLFNWLTLTAGCIFLLALGRQMGINRRGQWLIIAMIFTSSAIVELSGSGKTDIYAVAFAFATYYWAFQLKKENLIPISILIGLFGGLAVVAKISYAASFLPNLIIILVWKLLTQFNKEPFPSQFSPFIPIGLGAIFIIIQLPIKNQILFANPLAPYGMTDIFDQIWYGPDTIQRIRLTLPFALTFGQYWAQIGGITPLVLMFSPLFLLLPKPRNFFKSSFAIFSISAMIGLSCWLIYRPAVFAPRYFLACLLALALPTAKAAETFSNQDPASSRLTANSATLIILAVAFFYSTHVFLPKQTLELLIKDKPDCMIDPVQCEITNHLNKIIPIGERVFTNDSYRYWLRPDIIQCALTTPELENYFALTTSDQRWNFIVGRGFQSVLIYYRDIPLSNNVREDLLEIPNWLEITTIKTNSNLIYLRLTPKDTLHLSLYGCSKSGNSQAWDIFELSFEEVP